MGISVLINFNFQQIVKIDLKFEFLKYVGTFFRKYATDSLKVEKYQSAEKFFSKSSEKKTIF